MTTIEAGVRGENTKNRRLRREGWIPVILDQRSTVDTDNLSLQLRDTECDKLLREATVGGLVKLLVEGKEHKAFITEVQRAPGSGQVQHISFEELRPGKPVKSVAQLAVSGGNANRFEYILVRQSVPYEAAAEDMVENICLDLDRYDRAMDVTAGDINREQNSTFHILLEDAQELLHIRQKPGWGAGE
ncbi:hypothetical protein [Lachnoclostridium sp. Marseille-P6806]|uniref:hypothetical protein n=1 Tax=Lachnoclostridium sp. Marseille-P6806 TaxID=2364793 RepID=UPI0013EF367E|nr:hypothetical protein [Lachnoclostridium sp. Marseille-P6806]